MLSTYEQFSVSISSAFHDIQRIQRAVMARFGLKGSHARCIIALRNAGEGITAAQLSQVYEKDKAAISRTVADLESMGLVRRETVGGSHYRARIYLTDRGREVAAAVNQAAQAAVERAGEGLEEGQREIFYSVLGKICGNLRTICREGMAEWEESGL